MKMGTYKLMFFGILLACLGFYFQTTNPIFSSLFALIGAGFLFATAKRFTNERRRLKAEKAKKRQK